MTAFIDAPTAAATSIHGAVTTAQINTPTGITGINSLIAEQTNQSNAAPTKPRAFINVLFFDEQFKSYSGGFSTSMVGANSVVKDHYSELQNLTALKSGYVYIYCSNESPVPVFFDNIQVVHTRGAILEETHYYPFGLVMSGISSKAAGSLENKKSKFNGYELNTDFDINAYESLYRMNDPQIGRVWQIDPKPNLDMSPYSSMGNNPILLSDPLGDTTRVMIGDQYYFMQRNGEGGIGYYDAKGKLYEGKLDDFSQSLLTAANSIAGINDEEVQTRLTEVLGGGKMITMQEGLTNFDSKTGTLSWFDGKNGIMTDNGGNFEKPGPFSKGKRDSDLELVHEWLGHGFQHSKGILNNDRMASFRDENYNIIGVAKKVEADASTLVTRAAEASGRPQMGQGVYIEQGRNSNGEPVQMLYHVIPRGYLLTNSESQKPANYRRL